MPQGSQAIHQMKASGSAHSSQFTVDINKMTDKYRAQIASLVNLRFLFPSLRLNLPELLKNTDQATQAYL